MIALSGAEFRLEWTHSVEKQAWREYWRISEAGLVLTKAAVKGSGAGMEPGEGAVRDGDWWVWHPDLPAVAQLVLAASGATGDGWHVCDEQECYEIGHDPGEPIVLKSCP